MAELFWQASRGGHSAQRWESVSPTQGRLLARILKDKGKGAAKREICAAMGERWGLRTEYGQVTMCRLCGEDCVHVQRQGNGKGKQREGGGCQRCDEKVGHVLQGECNETT